MTKKAALTGMVVLTLGLLATGASAAPTVTITSPTNGATISRSVSPTLAVGGTVTFDAPQPSERTFYVREGLTPWLDVVQGSQPSTPATVASVSPLADEFAQPEDIDARNGVPFTLDGSRAITGVVSLTSYPEVEGMGAGAGLTRVDISVSGQVVGGNNEVLGTTTVSYTATPLQGRYDTPWSIQPPAALDKKDFSSLRLTLTVRGRNVNHGWRRANSTNLTMPIYTSSFSRAVEVSLDNGLFASTGVNLSEDKASYAAILSTPAAGAHFIKVRAVQGSSKSTVVSSSFSVTA
jgi:hypothetical protein